MRGDRVNPRVRWHGYGSNRPLCDAAVGLTVNHPCPTQTPPAGVQSSRAEADELRGRVAALHMHSEAAEQALTSASPQAGPAPAARVPTTPPPPTTTTMTAAAADSELLAMALERLGVRADASLPPSHRTRQAQGRGPSPANVAMWLCEPMPAAWARSSKPSSERVLRPGRFCGVFGTRLGGDPRRWSTRSAT